MAGNLSASVILCTRDRSSSLFRTLTSICAAAENVSENWELLVVDNGSKDDTQDVILQFADRLPIRCVEEPRAGLSNARNAGVAASAGDFIIWTDDDVHVDPNWLSVYFETFRLSPEHAIFGGKATPIYDAPAEDWFTGSESALGSLLAIRDEAAWTFITKGRVPYGLNYAIRGKEQRSHLYDPNLGVAPGRRRGGEELAVINSILEQGYTGLWNWGAHVHHVIPSSRQGEEYIKEYYASDGWDYPVAGQMVGILFRSKGVLVALRSWSKSACAYWFYRWTDRVRSVPHLVSSTRAKASLRRYLGMAV